LIEAFTVSGMTRRQFCGQHSIPVTTLDAWRRQQKSKPKLVRVKVEPQQCGRGFVLVLGNGRRIESSWSFADEELDRLIRVAESA
jgi:hypothetical protein